MDLEKLKKAKYFIPVASFVAYIVKTVLGIDIPTEALYFALAFVVIIVTDANLDDFMEKQERIEKIKKGFLE